MVDFNFNTVSGKRAFERWVATTVRNEVSAYTRTALSQSLGGQRQVQNNLDNTNLSIVPIGSIIPFGGITLPREFLWCDGSLINKDTYARLFTILGNNRYGTDTATQFYLPDFRNKLLLGMANVIDTVTNVNSIAHNIGSLAVATQAVDINHIHSHNHSFNFNHGHSNNNAGQSDTHNHAFQGATTSISRAAGNQAGLAASTHNHGFTGSTATHTHAHGLNSTNINIDVGQGSSNTADVTWTPNAATDNTTHGHLFNGSLTPHPFGSQTLNFIIKY